MINIIEELVDAFILGIRVVMFIVMLVAGCAAGLAATIMIIYGLCIGVFAWLA